MHHLAILLYVAAVVVVVAGMVLDRKAEGNLHRYGLIALTGAAGFLAGTALGVSL
jgi:hypothetical protein